MKKIITIIGINYYPESTSTGLYTTQLAEYFQENNFQVNVICGFPYYPAWKIEKSYVNRKKFIKETINGVTIFRYKQYVPKKPTFLKRIFHLIDFSIGSLFNILKIKKTDVVLCIVPFTTTTLLGKLLSIKTKAKLWVHIQDFEFDAATETIINKNKKHLLLKFLFYIEKNLLKRADLNSTISQSMLKKLQYKVNNNKGKVLLPNWVDLNEIKDSLEQKHPFLVSEKFKILYSGNIGEKQDWNFFLEFAKHMLSYKDVEIIIVGDGSKREWLINKINKLNNVIHHFPVPYSELSQLLSSADLHFLFQKDKVKDTVMPSKMLAMMASKKPSLITGNLYSEVAKIINESKSGKYFSNSDIKLILEYVIEVKENKNLASMYGKSARKYVEQNYEKTLILEKFKQVTNKLIGEF